MLFEKETEHSPTAESIDRMEEEEDVDGEEMCVEREVASARNRALSAEAMVSRARERERIAMSETRASLSKFEQLMSERAISLASLEKSRAELQLKLELAERRAFGEESDSIQHSVKLDEESRAQLRRATAEQQVLRQAAAEQVKKKHVCVFSHFLYIDLWAPCFLYSGCKNSEVERGGGEAGA